MCYFCRPGGLAELVDCTGLENRRAARYRGSNPSASAKKVSTSGHFFATRGFTPTCVPTRETPCTFEIVNEPATAFQLSHVTVPRMIGILMGLTIWTTAFAQRDWRTDALVQRLPSGQAYLEIQTAWESDLASAGDSLTLTVVVARQNDVLGFRKSRLEVRPDVPDSSALSLLHVDRISVPDGPCTVEWMVLRDDDELHASSLTYRISPSGMPEIADPMVVATHARASEMSDANMVHSGMDLIPSVGKHIAQDQAMKMYVELHKMDEVVGRDSLFLLAYGWADAQGNWDAAFTKYKRLTAQPVVPVFESLPTSATAPNVQRPVLKLEARTKRGEVIVSRDVVLAPRRHPQPSKAVQAGPAPSSPPWIRLSSWGMW